MVIEPHWLVLELVILLVKDMRELVLPITLFLLQLKLQRELPIDNVEKQNSILLPYGGVVLMAIRENCDEYYSKGIQETHP